MVTVEQAEFVFDHVDIPVGIGFFSHLSGNFAQYGISFQEGVELYLDDVHVAVQGGRNPAYREEDGQRVMKQSEITVRVLLGRGDAADTVWTCDFSHEYVTINADYRS